MRRDHGSRCVFCKTFVKEIMSFIPQNKTEKSVKDALDGVCRLIYKNGPEWRLNRCEKFVDAYTKQLVEILVDESSPEMICVLLEQCAFQSTYDRGFRTLIPEEEVSEDESSEEEADQEDPVAAPSMSELISSLDPTIKKDSLRTCVECKLFINYLRNAVEDPDSEGKIVDYLRKNLCFKLEDAKLKAECKALVDQYSETLFKAITEELDPQKACMSLGACRRRKISTLLVGDNVQESKILETLEAQDSKELEPTPANHVRVPKVSTKDGVFCDQCVNIVTQIDEYLSAHPVDHDVSTLIDQVCNRLPIELAKQECTVLVETFGQDIAQAIADMESPRQLCTKISLC